MARLFLAWSTQKEHTYGEEAEAESSGGVDSSWGPAVDKLLLSFLKQGELVWLKRFEGETAPELRPSCLRVLRKVGQRAWRVGCGGCCQETPTGLDWSLLNAEAPSLQKGTCYYHDPWPIVMTDTPHRCHHPTQHPPCHTPSPYDHLRDNQGTAISTTIITGYDQHRQRTSSCTLHPSTYLFICPLSSEHLLCSGLWRHSSGEERQDPFPRGTSSHLSSLLT